MHEKNAGRGRIFFGKINRPVEKRHLELLDFHTCLIRMFEKMNLTLRIPNALTYVVTRIECDRYHVFLQIWGNCKSDVHG